MEPRQWEYTTIRAFPVNTRSYQAYLDELNRLGEDGWQVVAAFPSGLAAGGGDLLLTRPK